MSFFSNPSSASNNGAFTNKRRKGSCAYNTCEDASLPAFKCVHCNSGFHENCAKLSSCLLQFIGDDEYELTCNECAKSIIGLNPSTHQVNRLSQLPQTPMRPASERMYDRSWEARIESIIERTIDRKLDSALEKKFDEKFENSAERHIEKIKSAIQDDLYAMQSKIDHHDNDIIDIKEDLKDIKENKVVSDSLRETNPLALLNITSMLQNEMRDSTRRESNLIIKGLKETNSMPNDTGITVENSSSAATNAESSDLEVVKEILSKLKSAANLVSLDLENISVKRIGLRKGTKPRNVCVGLKCREDVFSILNNAKMLSSNIRVSTDKTKLQMSGLNQAYDLANKHNDEHPGDKLKVKHIKNVPSLIDATGKRRDPKNTEHFLGSR